MFVASACLTEPSFDKAKFTELNRAAQDLKAAIGSGTSCDIPDTIVQRLASGIDALKDRTPSKAERDLLAAYADLLAVYKDGLLLCRSRTHLTNFDFVPRGRIYVTQQLDAIIEKYDLRTERHVYKPTGAYWKSIPADSIRVIWENALTVIKNIETKLKYH